MQIKTKFKTVDEYINSHTEDVQKILNNIRKTIKSAAPQAEESISYNMPAYKFHGPLVYFAVNKNHIGFYGIPTSHTKFTSLLSAYKTGRGSVQFPFNQRVPLDL